MNCTRQRSWGPQRVSRVRLDTKVMIMIMIIGDNGDNYDCKQSW